MLDYIIVGKGIAGIAFAMQLLNEKKRFIILDDNNQRSSSRMAIGLFNPFVLKRFTPVWNARQQMDLLLPFWKKIEKITQNKYIEHFNIYRIFNSIEEQNSWGAVCDTPCGIEYLNDKIIYRDISGISARLGFGEVQKTGRILLQNMLDDMQVYFLKHRNLVLEKFDYSRMKICKNSISYKELKASKIVFCEGFNLKNNPYFNKLPLIGNKGQWIKIKCEKLKLDKLIKAGVFILQVKESIFLVGATFDFYDKTIEATDTARKDLVKKLRKVLTYPFEVIQQGAGIRPTVLDRRPLLGRHPKYNNICIFNGLGTRGVMIAPQLAVKLCDYLENNIPLDKEIDIKRFF